MTNADADDDSIELEDIDLGITAHRGVVHVHQYDSDGEFEACLVQLPPVEVPKLMKYLERAAHQAAVQREAARGGSDE